MAALVAWLRRARGCQKDGTALDLGHAMRDREFSSLPYVQKISGWASSRPYRMHAMAELTAWMSSDRLKVLSLSLSFEDLLCLHPRRLRFTMSPNTLA